MRLYVIILNRTVSVCRVRDKQHRREIFTLLFPSREQNQKRRQRNRRAYSGFASLCSAVERDEPWCIMYARHSAEVTHTSGPVQLAGWVLCQSRPSFLLPVSEEKRDLHLHPPATFVRPCQQWLHKTLLFLFAIMPLSWAMHQRQELETPEQHFAEFLQFKDGPYVFFLSLFAFSFCFFFVTLAD